MPDELSELREGYAEVGGQRLHYVEAGDGPLIVLLHGFPEFWYAWREQFFRNFLRGARPDANTPEDIERYVRAWSQAGAATAASQEQLTAVWMRPRISRGCGQ